MSSVEWLFERRVFNDSIIRKNFIQPSQAEVHPSLGCRAADATTPPQNPKRRNLKKTQFL
jgi:hypothetical protein